MKRLAVFLCTAAAFSGCAQSDTTADTSSPAAATPAETRLTAADVAGNWTVQGRNANDSVLVTYDLAVANDSTYTITFSSGQKVSGRIVALAGDSLVLETGSFPSVLRKGVQVRSSAVVRLRDGKLVGTTVGRYNVRTADSVMTLRVEGTRKP